MLRPFLPGCLMGAVLAVCACGGTTEDAGAEATGATSGSAGSGGGSETGGSEIGGGDASGANGGTGAQTSGGSGADSGSGGAGAQTSGGSGADSGSSGAGAQTSGGSGAVEAGSGGTPGGGTAGVIEGGSGGVEEFGGTSGGGNGGSGASDSICSLPPEPGSCMAYIPSYYFDSATARCEEFVYGGCGGNDNRFATAAECRAACGGLAPAACALPPERGPCDDSFPSYYYDATTGLCEAFSYGGCEGNANRFETQEACESACRGAPNPDCPISEPAGACTEEGAQCSYDQSGCQCQLPHDSYYCQGVPECTVVGTGGGSGFLPPDPGTGGVAGNGGSDRPAPGVRVCDCTSGSWLCSWAS